MMDQVHTLSRDETEEAVLLWLWLKGYNVTFQKERGKPSDLDVFVDRAKVRVGGDLAGLRDEGRIAELRGYVLEAVRTHGRKVEDQPWVLEVDVSDVAKGLGLPPSVVRAAAAATQRRDDPRELEGWADEEGHVACCSSDDLAIKVYRTEVSDAARGK